MNLLQARHHFFSTPCVAEGAIHLCDELREGSLRGKVRTEWESYFRVSLRTSSGRYAESRRPTLAAAFAEAFHLAGAPVPSWVLQCDVTVPPWVPERTEPTDHSSLNTPSALPHE